MSVFFIIFIYFTFNAFLSASDLFLTNEDPHGQISKLDAKKVLLLQYPPVDIVQSWVNLQNPNILLMYKGVTWRYVNVTNLRNKDFYGPIPTLDHLGCITALHDVLCHYVAAQDNELLESHPHEDLSILHIGVYPRFTSLGIKTFVEQYDAIFYAEDPNDLLIQHSRQMKFSKEIMENFKIIEMDEKGNVIG